MSVTSAIKDSSNIHRVKTVASDVFEMLIDNLKKTDVKSVAVDQSTDTTDNAQLCRVFHGLLPLAGHTTGEIMFEKISAFSRTEVWI